jgi:hypothetical protein
MMNLRENTQTEAMVNQLIDRVDQIMSPPPKLKEFLSKIAVYSRSEYDYTLNDLLEQTDIGPKDFVAAFNKEETAKEFVDNLMQDQILTVTERRNFIYFSGNHQPLIQSSTPPSPYRIAGHSIINEDTTTTYTVHTRNVPDDTTLYWTLNHLTTQERDFGKTSGSFKINSNTGTFDILVKDDILTEGPQSFEIELHTVSKSGEVVRTKRVRIEDTSPVWGSYRFVTGEPTIGDYLSIPASNDFSLPGDFTIEFWMWINPGFETTHGILSQVTANPIDDISVTYSSLSGLLIIGGTITITAPPAQKWIHVAIVKYNGNLTIFYNGSIAGTWGSTSWTPSNSTGPLYIGVEQVNLADPASSIGLYDGLLTGIKICKSARYLYEFNPWARTRLISESIFTQPILVLQALQTYPYHDASPSHKTVINHDVVWEDSHPVPYPYGSLRLQMGGTGSDFASVNTGSQVLFSNTQNTFTVEAWICMTSNPVTNDIDVPSAISYGALPPYSGLTWSFGPLADRRLSFYWYNSGLKYICGTTILDINKWYHIAVTANDGVLNLYVNGVVEGTSAYDPLQNSPLLTDRDGISSYIVFGQYADMARFYGYVSNVRIIDGISEYAYGENGAISKPLPVIDGTQLMLYTVPGENALQGLKDSSPNEFDLTLWNGTTTDPFNPFDLYPTYEDYLMFGPRTATRTLFDQVIEAVSITNGDPPVGSYINVNGTTIASDSSIGIGHPMIVGHTLAIIDHTNGSTKATVSFNTYQNPPGIASLNSTLESVEAGDILILVSHDSCSCDITTRNILTSIYGSSGITWLDERYAHIVIAVRH